MNKAHPVFQLICERYHSGSTPQNRKDLSKLGLAIEGGGMRGVVSTAMAAALHYLGLVGVFDAVYGSSAGAFAGTHFVTGKMPVGPTIFYDDLTNHKFINLLRGLLPGRTVMDLDFLLVDILSRKRPLNWEGVIRSEIPLKIVVSSVRDRAAHCYDEYHTRDELFTLLKASATIPLLAGPPIPYKSDLLYDASLYEPIPFLSALQDKCTHVLVLLSRSYGAFNRMPSLFERVVARRLSRLQKGLGEDYLQHREKYTTSLEQLYAGNSQVAAAPSIYAVYLPDGTEELPRFTKNRRKVVEAAQAGIRAVIELLGAVPDVNLHSVLLPITIGGESVRVKDQ